MKRPDVETARAPEGQQYLFPVSPQAVCEEIGLDWRTALMLKDTGWLSFNPAIIRQLNESQDTELRFLGALVTAGCDERMLRRLLQTLDRPYSYRLDRMYYDWPKRRWECLPEVNIQPARIFSDWLEELKEDRDQETLDSLAAEISDTIAFVKQNK